MDFIPYSRQHVSENDIAAVTEVLRSDFLTQGDVGPAFEDAFATRHAVSHAVAVSNATAGLHIACLALDVGPGSLVWTVPNTFLASANCARYCGADVDFVDIDPVTRNISVAALAEKLELASRRRRLPQVVVPVDFSGLPADMREIRQLADQYGFRVLEDASHATGASYLGRPVGSTWSDITVFSFHAVKIVTAAEGGMVTTNDPGLAHRLRLLRSHGMTRAPSELTAAPEGDWVYEQHVLGFNYRMTELQAALGLSQLSRLNAMHVQRIALADTYDRLLSDLPVVRPVRRPDRVSSWHLYVIEISGEAPTRRASVFRAMRQARIGVNVHYIPVHLQPYYAKLGFQAGYCPAAEAYYARALSIPLFPGLRHEQQEHVVDTLRIALATP